MAPQQASSNCRRSSTRNLPPIIISQPVTTNQGVAKAITYAQKVIVLAKADAPAADKSNKLSAGMAHSTLGYAYAKQDKVAAAIPELKTAATLLKGQDDVAYATALYRLGWAYGKTKQIPEARAALEEAIKIPGPLQAPSEELLKQVNTTRTKPK